MARKSLKARLLLAFALVLTVTCVRPATVKAEGAALLKVDEMTEIDGRGNATAHMTVTAPTAVYTTMKSNTPNVALLLRRLGVGRGWSALENADAKFNDVKNRLEITYQVRGFARVEQGKRWSVGVDKDASLELLEAHRSLGHLPGDGQLGGQRDQRHRTHPIARREHQPQKQCPMHVVLLRV